MLGGFLAALGVDPERIPGDLESRSALYRSILARRRVLILLDDAGALEQVGPLLPGSSTCRVLVPSRSDLTGLVVNTGATRMTLDLLEADEALELVRGVLGRAATPAQALRAAMRLYEQGLGMSGFMLCLMDFYTGARWGELVGQQQHEYDAEKRGIEIRTPLQEVGGKVYKGARKSDDHHSDSQKRPPTRRGNSRPQKGRTQNPCGDSVRGAAAGIAVLYEQLTDGVELNDAGAGERRPPILPTFTFHEGRHTHARWLTEDGSRR